MLPVLYVVVPCYNEESVLPVTAPLFLKELTEMQNKGLVSPDSKIMFVDDGSRDNSWEIISELSRQNNAFIGIRQSRNRGHQSAVLAGLMEAKDRCDITVSIDCDGQDDITAMEKMVKEYADGCEIVYGVRSNRQTDTFFKRFTAQSFYKLMNRLGAETVYNHADYRLVSSRVLNELARFKEVNLYLRGMIPLVGFKSTSVYYERKERVAGKSRYSIGKMVGLAVDGITSLSIKPLRLITAIGIAFSLVSFVGIIWSVIDFFLGKTVAGWSSIMCAVLFVGGVQMVCLGVIGEYIGKIYLETKGRPKYIISERTQDKK